MSEVSCTVPVEVTTHLQKDLRYANPIARAALLGCHSMNCEGQPRTADDALGEVAVSVTCLRGDCEVVAAGEGGLGRSLAIADQHQTVAEEFKRMPGAAKTPA